MVLSLCSVAAVQAAVPVEDIQHRKSQAVQSAVSQPAAIAIPAPDVLPEPEPVATDSYSQLQLLREEVMELRGLVEQLSNEVQLLKQRQMDDYMDLDRRLSHAATSSVSGGSTVGKTSPSTVDSNNTRDSDSGAVESYSAAYNLLKEGNIDSAIIAFKKHIAQYPDGKYTANCHYWLGEVYLLKNNLELARQSFTTVVESYPEHRKVDDATFKLGKVYHLLGKTDKAKPLLKSVAEGSSSTAPLAKKYLSDKF